MDAKNHLKTGDRRFLMHRSVEVVMVYSSFQLVKVRYAEENAEFCVDVCALTTEPNYTNSISLGALRRNSGEQYHVLY